MGQNKREKQFHRQKGSCSNPNQQEPIDGLELERI
jgi:hypothetical protein